LLRALLYGVSAQRPTHSLFVAGEQLPLEARMGGIFLGVLSAAALLVLLGRLRARRLPPGLLGLACWLLIAATGLDGLNAFLYDGGLPHAYAPNTALRLLTGLGAGVGLAFLVAPVVAGVVWKSPTDDASIEDPIELAMGIGGAVLLGAVILVAPAPLLYPLALAMLASVLLAFGVANMYVVVGTTGRAGLARSGSDLYGPLVVGVGLALLELAALAALRGWLATAFGFTWGI
jgi:uncharacterized membrane protein